MKNPPSKIPNPKSYFALLLLALAGCGATAIAQPKAVDRPAAVEVVITGKPTLKTLTLTTTQPARIEALEQTPIHAKVAAYVGEVLVDYGDKVEKDQVLIRLIAPELDAAVAQNRALLDRSRVQVMQAEAGAKAVEATVTTAQSRLAQAEAGTDRAQADVGRWRSEYSRLNQLAANASITRQVVDETQQKLGAAEASLKEALAAIDAARAVVLQAQAEAARAASDVAAAKAQVQVAAATLAHAEAERSYLNLHAPFAGVVTLRHVDPGHLVQPAGGASAPLLVIARSDKLRIFVAVPEVEAGYVNVGDNVTIEVPSLRGLELKGQVTRTSFALDIASRSLETMVDIDNAGPRLRPGLFATAKIVLEEQPDALALPSAAVVRQGKEAFCYRLLGGKAVKTPLALGIKVGDEFAVAGGLGANDTVILNKAAALKDGQAVEELKPAAK